jgi:hypothetical protein
MARSAFIATVFLVLLQSAAVSADPIQVSAVPSEASISEGETLAIDIVVSGVPGGDVVSAYDLTLAFDPGILGFVDVVFGLALGDASAFEVLNEYLYPYGIPPAGDPDPGLVNIAASSLLLFELFDLQPSGTDIVLATLLFEGIGVGESAITFVADTVLGEPGIIVKDFLGFPFLGGDVGAAGSRITVTEAVAVNEPGTLALLTAGLLLLLLASGRRTGAESGFR